MLGSGSRVSVRVVSEGLPSPAHGGYLCVEFVAPELLHQVAVALTVGEGDLMIILGVITRLVKVT